MLPPAVGSSVVPCEAEAVIVEGAVEVGVPPVVPVPPSVALPDVPVLSPQADRARRRLEATDKDKVFMAAG